MSELSFARCACGQVECQVTGAPFLSAVCYCDDCQNAARNIERAGQDPPVAEPDGGTALCLIRDDNFRIARGAELLQPYRLDPASATSRMVASCCNAAMFLTFADGRFWKSVMINRMVPPGLAIEMRLCTRFRTSNLPWPDAAPRHGKFPLSAFLKVGRQWLNMKMGR